jgi:bacterioferritin
MEPQPGVVDRLNSVLTVELTAINQYFIHAEMARNWGYERLAEKYRDISLAEMKDTQELIRRILLFDGLPNMQRLNQVMVGEDAAEQLQLNLQAEMGAIATLREGVEHCMQVGDYATRLYFEEMIRDEEEHVDWLETQLEAVRQLGLENYLAQQLHD